MLTPPAQQIITDFLSLPFPNQIGIQCPYYNNRRRKIRGGLRALIGKGTPAEIVEEALIISMKQKIDLAALTPDEIKKFLVNSKIGIDCSALACYILDAELKARGLSPLKKYISFPSITNPLRRLLTIFRFVENVSVKTLIHDRNSVVITVSQIKPGDIISIIGSGLHHDYDHVLVVHDCSSEKYKRDLKTTEPATLTIHYTHSLQWSSDGKYNHGVRQGTITIADPEKLLVNQQWDENGKSGLENETLEKARQAERIEIRRLKALTT